MKKLLFIFSLFCICSSVIAGGRNLGVGILLGNPSSLAVKYKLENNHYLNGGIGYAPFTESGMVIHADYVHRDFDLFPQVEYLNFYYGFGARFSGEDNGMGLGARGVIGAYLKHISLPMEFFFETAPVFQLFPDTELGLDFGIGIYYFLDTSGY